MQKIKFNDDYIFDAAPIGISHDPISKRRRISFRSDLEYDEVLALLSDKNNIGKITYCTDNGIIIGVFTDCVMLKSISYDISSQIYTAEFSTDATEQELQELRVEVQQLRQIVDTLTAIQAQEKPEEEPEEEPEIEPEGP